jgi:CSLREA domain-containing protein
LGSTLKLLSSSRRFFQFTRTTSGFEKKEDFPMKIQEQFMSRLSNVINRIRTASWTRRPKSRGQLLMRVLVLVIVLVLAVVPFWRVFAYSFIVNSTADRVDSNPGDGICRTSANTCTLRAAIQEANASPGLDDIYVPAGVYAITIPPMNDNFIDNGDFDITESVVIDGAGEGTTILDGGNPPSGSPPVMRGLDRLVEIHPSADAVTISGLTIREGYTAESGGGIQFGAELLDLRLPVRSGTLV